LNQPYFAIEAEPEEQESPQAQRQCVICGDAWTPGAPRVPLRILLWRAGEQIGDLCEACLRRGSHAALSRLIDRIQVERQNMGALDAMVGKIGMLAPAEWESTLKEWDKRKNSALDKS
jgi:hypothetical protein